MNDTATPPWLTALGLHVDAEAWRTLVAEPARRVVLVEEAIDRAVGPQAHAMACWNPWPRLCAAADRRRKDLIDAVDRAAEHHAGAPFAIAWQARSASSRGLRGLLAVQGDPRDIAASALNDVTAVWFVDPVDPALEGLSHAALRARAWLPDETSGASLPVRVAAAKHTERWAVRLSGGDRKRRPVQLAPGELFHAKPGDTLVIGAAQAWRVPDGTERAVCLLGVDTTRPVSRSLWNRFSWIGVVPIATIGAHVGAQALGISSLGASFAVGGVAGYLWHRWMQRARATPTAVPKPDAAAPVAPPTPTPTPTPLPPPTPTPTPTPVTSDRLSVHLARLTLLSNAILWAFIMTDSGRWFAILLAATVVSHATLAWRRWRRGPLMSPWLWRTTHASGAVTLAMLVSAFL